MRGLCCVPRGGESGTAWPLMTLKRRDIFSGCYERHEPILLPFALHISIILPLSLPPFHTLL